jgi:hypothetical protein
MSVAHCGVSTKLTASRRQNQVKDGFEGTVALRVTVVDPDPTCASHECRNRHVHPITMYFSTGISTLLMLGTSRRGLMQQCLFRRVLRAVLVAQARTRHGRQSSAHKKIKQVGGSSPLTW